jgi:hypothetical protein
MSLMRPFVRRISEMSTNLINFSRVLRRRRSDGNDNASHRRSPPFVLERTGFFTSGFRSTLQRNSVRVDAVVWIASCLVTILGLAKAATSEQPFLWVALWPAPVVFASTVFTFVRQGFHVQDGVLVLGRRLE